MRERSGRTLGGKTKKNLYQRLSCCWFAGDGGEDEVEGEGGGGGQELVVFRADDQSGISASTCTRPDERCHHRPQQQDRKYWRSGEIYFSSLHLFNFYTDIFFLGREQRNSTPSSNWKSIEYRSPDQYSYTRPDLVLGKCGNKKNLQTKKLFIKNLFSPPL